MTIYANRGFSRRAAIGGVAAVTVAFVGGGKPSGAASTPGLEAPADVTSADAAALESWLLTTCPDRVVRLEFAELVAR